MRAALLGAASMASMALGSPSSLAAVNVLFVCEACAADDAGDGGESPQAPPVSLPRREQRDGDAPCEGEQRRTLYTRDSLASALCLMGAKPRHSLKVAARVFDTLGVLARRLQLPGGAASAVATAGLRVLPHRLPRPVVRAATFAGGAAELPRPQFEALVAWALAEYQYAKADQLEDLRLACRRAARRRRARRFGLTLRRRRIHERRTAVFVLLCGTSGTGKSTLASLLVRTRQTSATRQHGADVQADARHRRRAWASPQSSPPTLCATWCVRSSAQHLFARACLTSAAVAAARLRYGELLPAALCVDVPGGRPHCILGRAECGARGG